MSWTPEDASEAEAWGLAQGCVGWLREEDYREGRRLSDIIASLRQEAAELESTLAHARAAGFAEGLSAAEEVLRDARGALAAERDVLAERAAAAALDVASAYVRRDVAHDPALVLEQVRTRIDGADRPTRVRVHPAAVEAVAAQLEVEVVGDEALGIADSVVEFRDGKEESRLADTLARWAALVRSTIAGET